MGPALLSGVDVVVQRLALGIDTCTRWLNLALISAEGRLLGGVHEISKTHATGLVAAVERLLGGCSASYKDLVVIGAVTGPGSFTGLRVGLAAALGFSQALGIHAYGMDSLTALAECASSEGDGVALLDARRFEVYVRRFTKKNSKAQALSAPEALPPSQAIPAGFDPAWAIGDGVPLVPSLPSGCALFPEVPNLAIPAARLAICALKSSQPAEPLAALYVRPPDAKLPTGNIRTE